MYISLKLLKKLTFKDSRLEKSSILQPRNMSFFLCHSLMKLMGEQSLSAVFLRPSATSSRPRYKFKQFKGSKLPSENSRARSKPQLRPHQEQQLFLGDNSFLLQPSKGKVIITRLRITICGNLQPKNVLHIPLKQASGKSIFAAVLQQQPRQLKLPYPEQPCSLFVPASLLQLHAALQHFQELEIPLPALVFQKLLLPVCFLVNMNYEL